jgi:hypothetical protein
MFVLNFYKLSKSIQNISFMAQNQTTPQPIIFLINDERQPSYRWRVKELDHRLLGAKSCLDLT